jgi:hypothetical protein
MTLLVVPCIYDMLNRDKSGADRVKVVREKKPKRVRIKKIKEVIEEMASVEDLDG